jgi:nucleoside phosphorylase
VGDVSIAIQTFTETEAAAVRGLLGILSNPSGPNATVWTAKLRGEVIEGKLSDGSTARIQHTALLAQGNAIAGAALARATKDTIQNWDVDYFIFYGCCGAVEPALVGQVFRVDWVSYMSLGVVDPAPGGEVVKLRNKWIVPTEPNTQAPLKPIELPAGSASAPGSVFGLDLNDAHVLATDQVVHVSPGKLPKGPIKTPPPPASPIYKKGEWTYSEGLAWYIDLAKRWATPPDKPKPVLIEMESFGIASTMEALGLSYRVIVLRVVTDWLSNHQAQTDKEQLDLLMKGLPGLASALGTILEIGEDGTKMTPNPFLSQVRRLRAGNVRPPAAAAAILASTPSLNPDSTPSNWDLVRIVSAALAAWEKQLARVDRFSLPLYATQAREPSDGQDREPSDAHDREPSDAHDREPSDAHDPEPSDAHDREPSDAKFGPRANAATTAQLFLGQVRSDYRRVAWPELDLYGLEEARKSEDGRIVLDSARLSSDRSVAVLAVGQHLASRRGAAPSEVLGALERWIDPNDNLDVRERYEISFGEVLGPVVRLALDIIRSPDDSAIDIILPRWAYYVGIPWCLQFLETGARILQAPADLLPPIASDIEIE